MNRPLRIARRLVTDLSGSLREIRRRLDTPHRFAAADPSASSELVIYGLRSQLARALARHEAAVSQIEAMEAAGARPTGEAADRFALYRLRSQLAHALARHEAAAARIEAMEAACTKPTGEAADSLALYRLRSQLGHALARVEALSAENERLKTLPVAPAAIESLTAQVKILVALTTSRFRDELRDAEQGVGALSRRCEGNIQRLGDLGPDVHAAQPDAVAELFRRLSEDRANYDALSASLQAMRRQLELELRSLGASGASVPGATASGATLYLDLMELVLTGELFDDPAADSWSAGTYDPIRRQVGRDWPRSALTMIGSARMRNLRQLTERALADGVPGDFIETGVWRGGACIYMRAILQAHGDTKRSVFVADSFAGLPPPDPESFPADQDDRHHTYHQLAVSRAEVEAGFARFGLLNQVVFLEGWFKDSLPTAPIERLAVLRLDGDMYESTWQALEALYDKVSPGGYVIVDDYILKPCAMAIDDFRRQRGIEAPLEEVDGAAVWWQVGKPAA